VAEKQKEAKKAHHRTLRQELAGVKTSELKPAARAKWHAVAFDSSQETTACRMLSLRIFGFQFAKAAL